MIRYTSYHNSNNIWLKIVSYCPTRLPCTASHYSYDIPNLISSYNIIHHVTVYCMVLHQNPFYLNILILEIHASEVSITLWRNVLFRNRWKDFTILFVHLIIFYLSLHLSLSLPFSPSLFISKYLIPSPTSSLSPSLNHLLHYIHTSYSS